MQFRLGAIIGPLQSEREAELVYHLWTFRSRAARPRAAYCCAIGEFFGLETGIDVDIISGQTRHWRAYLQGDHVCIERQQPTPPPPPGATTSPPETLRLPI